MRETNRWTRPHLWYDMQVVQGAGFHHRVLCLLIGTILGAVLVACGSGSQESNDRIVEQSGDSQSEDSWAEAKEIWSEFDDRIADEDPDVVQLANLGTLEELRDFAEDGGDLDATTRNGVSAVMDVVGIRNDMLSLLLELGASPDLTDSDGMAAINLTAVREAPEPMRVESARLLIEAGADLTNAPTSGEWSGLSACETARLRGDTGLESELC